MNEPEIDWPAEWVEKHIGRTLNDFQRRTVVLLCQAMRCGPYDFANTFRKAEWADRWVRFNVGRMSGCPPTTSTASPHW